MAIRLAGRSILSLFAAAVLGGGALSLAAPAPAALAAAAQHPAFKGEMGDFSYFAGAKPVPPIAFKDADGKSLSLADFKGRVVLVNFWATWCAPCRGEMTSLDRLEGQLGGKDFIVVDISLDRQGKAAVAPFLMENDLTHLGIYLDPEGESFRAWQGQGVPTSFVIGRDGLARGVMLGPAQWDSPAALELIKYFIAEGKAGEVHETRRLAPAGARPAG